MDYIPSILQFDQQSKDQQELFQIISSNFPSNKLLDQHENIHQIHFEDNYHDYYHDHHQLQVQVHPPTPSQDGRDNLANKRRHDDDDQENPNEKKIKKKNKDIHREIERQRRQEMAKLYSSLRFLVPLQHLKGKRSISDQMHVAVNYIKELQRKKQELINKRDELLLLCPNLSNHVDIDHGYNDNNISNNNSESIVCVRHNNHNHNSNFRAGIEVFVNTALGEQGLSLAKLIRVLGEQGLNVVRCVSGKVNQRFLHTIESEVVSGERNVDLNELEQKLKNLDMDSI